MHRVFVYGTLRKGGMNHGLMAGAEFIGPGQTVSKYTLHISGRLPWVNPLSQTSTICGEVYDVNDDQLTELDRLEGHPNWYERKEVMVTWVRPDGFKTVTMAWLYFALRQSFHLCKSQVVKDGDYLKAIAISSKKSLVAAIVENFQPILE